MGMKELIVVVMSSMHPLRAQQMFHDSHVEACALCVILFAPGVSLSAVIRGDIVYTRGFVKSAFSIKGWNVKQERIYITHS